MSTLKSELRYYDHADLMAVAQGGYTQGRIDAVSRSALNDALGDEEELYDYISWKWAGDGYTTEDILKIAQEAETEEK